MKAHASTPFFGKQEASWLPAALAKAFSQDPGCHEMARATISECAAVQPHHLYVMWLFQPIKAKSCFVFPNCKEKRQTDDAVLSHSVVSDSLRPHRL